MKEFLQKFWLMIAGFFSSIFYQGVNDLHAQGTNAQEMAVKAAEQFASASPEHTMLWYFMIGVVGAVGGLLVKIIWACLKRLFPKLKTIDA
ncbi:hypothetical protein [uncultured Draconibacterium sp.]|uniref:hypothetical protein n=1 Tax=uncultured Draconibacterium sp. TaxID=1573823 RepID=UPI0025E800FC|nr:hypothetical protein [uncultured Draconibacterium sp.]